MEILIVRHGKAGDREDWVDSGKSDDLRPLTDKGISEFKSVAKELRELCPELQKVYSSPLTRAQQTAQILCDAYGFKKPEIIEELRPWTDLDGFYLWLSKQNPVSRIALVGHEPHLAFLTTSLISDKKEPHVFFKKGGAALVSTESPPKAGGFLLHWLIQPKFLL